MMSTIKIYHQFRFRIYCFFWAVLGRRFKHTGSQCHIEPGVKFSGHRNISISNRVLINGGSRLLTGRMNSELQLGDNCEIGYNCLIRTFDGSVIIGAHSSLNFCGYIIGGSGGVHIGDGVRIGPHCIIVASRHVFSDVDIPIYQQGYSSSGIIIEDNVWIGANVTVLDGVTIGRGSVIGAGAVVSASVPPYSIAVGVPAKVIKSRKQLDD